MKGRFGRILIALSVALLGTMLFVPAALAGDPPWDTDTYRADCTGDFLTTALEYQTARDLAALKPRDCTGVIPGTTSKGDTIDLTGDGLVTVLDVNGIKDM